SNMRPSARALNPPESRGKAHRFVPDRKREPGGEWAPARPSASEHRILSLVVLDQAANSYSCSAPARATPLSGLSLQRMAHVYRRTARPTDRLPQVDAAHFENNQSGRRAASSVSPSLE